MWSMDRLETCATAPQSASRYVHAAAGRHDTFGLWNHVMDPLEQPRQKQLQRDDETDGIYHLDGDGPSDDDDDDDLQTKRTLRLD